MELRSARRYRVALPVVFFWGTGSNFFEGAGTTRDLSVKGMFVITKDPVPLGSDLWLKVSVPGIREGSQGTELQGNGQVIRSEENGFATQASIGFSSDRTSRRSRSESPDKAGSADLNKSGEYRSDDVLVLEPR